MEPLKTAAVDPRVTITKSKVSVFEAAVHSSLPFEAAQTVMALCHEVFPAVNVRISKRKYNEFNQSILKWVPAHSEMALRAFQNAFQFDPHASTYTKELGQRMYARLKSKCEETSQSIYQAQRAVQMRSIDRLLEQRLKERITTTPQAICV
jgi:hypothetical protein